MTCTCRGRCWPKFWREWYVTPTQTHTRTPTHKLAPTQTFTNSLHTQTSSHTQPERPLRFDVCFMHTHTRAQTYTYTHNHTHKSTLHFSTTKKNLLVISPPPFPPSVRRLCYLSRISLSLSCTLFSRFPPHSDSLSPLSLSHYEYYES